MAKKARSAIPAQVAAKALFLSDRTCCVCRGHGKAVQIHHVDEDPNNGDLENLAVLCFECHLKTQLRGGFDRKLDAHQIRLYRDRWHEVVEQKWQAELILPVRKPPQGKVRQPKFVQAHIQGMPAYLEFSQLSEEDDKNSYSFQADYPQIMPEDNSVALETNLLINALITRTLQKFRGIDSGSRSHIKSKIAGDPTFASISLDIMSVAYKLGVFTDRLLTMEFVVQSYFAGAAHPNSQTKTLNFLLQPNSTALEFGDLFDRSSKYLDIVSKFCISSLHNRAMGAERLTLETVDDWITRGAGPQPQNFEQFLLEDGGIRVYFDAYQVASYAMGRQEVFIPKEPLIGTLIKSIEILL